MSWTLPLHKSSGSSDKSNSVKQLDDQTKLGVRRFNTILLVIQDNVLVYEQSANSATRVRLVNIAPKDWGSGKNDQLNNDKGEPGKPVELTEELQIELTFLDKAVCVDHKEESRQQTIIFTTLLHYWKVGRHFAGLLLNLKPMFKLKVILATTTKVPLT